MPKPVKTIAALTSPRTLGIEIATLLMTNPNKTFAIRRDSEMITIWEVEENEPTPDEPQ